MTFSIGSGLDATGRLIQGEILAQPDTFQVELDPDSGLYFYTEGTARVGHTEFNAIGTLQMGNSSASQHLVLNVSNRAGWTHYADEHAIWQGGERTSAATYVDTKTYGGMADIDRIEDAATGEVWLYGHASYQDADGARAFRFESIGDNLLGVSMDLNGDGTYDAAGALPTDFFGLVADRNYDGVVTTTETIQMASSGMPDLWDMMGGVTPYKQLGIAPSPDGKDWLS